MLHSPLMSNPGKSPQHVEKHEGEKGEDWCQSQGKTQKHHMSPPSTCAYLS